MTRSAQLAVASEPHSDREAALLAEVALGDVRAFEVLHRCYYSKVFSFSLRVVQAPDRAQEITNDTMLAVWRGAGKFAGRSRVSTWIFGIAYRIALKSRRKFWFERRHVEIDDSLGLVDEQSPSVDSFFAKRDVTRALTALSIELRTIVELTYRDGFSYGEIAEIVGCPEGTVKSRMSAARQKLRTILEQTME